jgi:hypothetical protein
MTTAISRKQAFDDSVPAMSDAEIAEALKAGRVAVGFRGEPVMLPPNEIGFIALKFAVLEGDTQVFLLDQFSARVLYKLIESVNDLDWKSDSLVDPAKAP